MQSPRIIKISWGRVEVEGYPAFRDVKLFPGGAIKWDWRENGTDHAVGIQWADLEPLLGNGAQEIILSRGVLGRLKVGPDLVAKLSAKGITVHVARTRRAAALYNKLSSGKPVGALIHSTC